VTPRRRCRHAPQPGWKEFSISVALNTARDQLVAAAGVIAEDVIDLVGVIGRHVLAAITPARRPRTAPRVVKRAISIAADLILACTTEVEQFLTRSDVDRAGAARRGSRAGRHHRLRLVRRRVRGPA